MNASQAATSCKKEIENVLPENNVSSPVTGTRVEDNVCGALEYDNPATIARMEKMEQDAQAYIAEHSGKRIEFQSAVTIPVVFHVIYNLPEQNISDAQLQSQIAALNKDFSASNGDISNVPSCFQPLIGNAGIQFTLAKRDPAGNVTSGIIRKATTVTSFSSDGAVCYSSLGGDNAWPASQYLNIWVCKKSGAAGYSSYPWSGSPATDGIIIGYNYVGTTGTFTNNWSYLKGRTVTHEAGHWLGLVHIWGDAACGNDLVGDTPPASAANGSCPAFPHVSSCSPNSNGDLFMNFMDYTYDDCRTMFTLGQVNRMQGYLNTTRAGLLTSNGGLEPVAGACNIPSGLNASSITTGSAVLSWVSTGAPGYNIQYKASTASTWSSASTSTNSIAISGLAAFTTYQFQVRSNCSGSSSAYSALCSFTTSPLSAACNVPSELNAVVGSSGNATLKWASTGAVSYVVMYKAVTASLWALSSSPATSVNVSWLSPSVTYEFKVQSVCAGGSKSAFSASTTFTAK